MERCASRKFYVRCAGSIVLNLAHRRSYVGGIRFLPERRLPSTYRCSTVRQTVSSSSWNVQLGLDAAAGLVI